MGGIHWDRSGGELTLHPLPKGMQIMGNTYVGCKIVSINTATEHYVITSYFPSSPSCALRPKKYLSPSCASHTSIVMKKRKIVSYVII
jgi:hypothetical protein